MAPARPRSQQRGEHDGFHQFEFGPRVQSGRTADRSDHKFADAIAVGRHRVGDFGRGERHGGVSARDFAGGSTPIAGHAGRNVHGDDFGQRKPAVDFADGVQHHPVCRARDAGAEQRVDHQGRVPGLRRNLARHRTSADLEHTQVEGGIALQGFGRGQQHHVKRRRAASRMQLAGDHHAVAAVVALTAQHHDALAAERGEAPLEVFDDAVSRVLHQHQARNAGLDRDPIDLAHFGRGQYLHMRRATTMVISSCNSPAPVHSTTASMVRAISSVESSFAYLSSTS